MEMGKVTKFFVQVIPGEETEDLMAPSSQKKKYELKVEDGEIDLSMLDLQEVPTKEIVKKKIHSLDLSNNHISVLPQNFATLVQLTKLDLSKNQLTQLPENFGELIKLKHLDLYKNQLQSLPLSFGNLKALKWLDLKDNPLLPVIINIAGPCLEDKQCQKCAKDVVAFYGDLQERFNKEKNLREQQRQKDLELNAQKQKQEKKTKKGKKIKSKESLKETVQTNHSKKIKKENFDNKSEDTSVKTSSSILKYFKYLFTIVIFISLTLFVLTAAQVSCISRFEEKALELWSECIKALPENYQGYGLQVGETIRDIHILTGKGIIILTRYFSEFRKNESVNIIVTEFTHVFQNVTQTAFQFYSKVFGN